MMMANGDGLELNLLLKMIKLNSLILILEGKSFALSKSLNYFVQ